MPHLYCYAQNVSADRSFGFLYEVYVENIESRTEPLSNSRV